MHPPITHQALNFLAFRLPSGSLGGWVTNNELWVTNTCILIPIANKK